MIPCQIAFQDDLKVKMSDLQVFERQLDVFNTQNLQSTEIMSLST
jgi:hypothetical protein